MGDGVKSAIETTGGQSRRMAHTKRGKVERVVCAVDRVAEIMYEAVWGYIDVADGRDVIMGQICLCLRVVAGGVLCIYSA